MSDKPRPVALRARTVETFRPGQSPIDDGVVVHDGRAILDVGPASILHTHPGAEIRDLGEVVLQPGRINGHTHLELSGMAGKTVLGRGFGPWAASLVQAMPARFDPALVRTAAKRMVQAGVAGIGDVATRFGRDVAQATEGLGLSRRVFLEWIGFKPRAVPDSPDLDPARFSLAGHALYSTAPETLVAAKRWTRARRLPFALHLAEHVEEVELLGSGVIPDALARLIPRDFKPPGLSPVAYAETLGLLDPLTLAAHCVHVDDRDLALLKASGATVCLCPLSNHAIGVGEAPVRKMDEAGLPWILGTDSKASNPEQDLDAELAFLFQSNGVQGSLTAIWSRTTMRAAHILGFTDLGRLAPGMAARFCTAPTA